MDKVDEFLDRHGIRDIDTDKQISNIIAQAEAGLEGRRSSLMMIPSYISAQGNIPAGIKTVVIDAGGTNLRIAVASYNDAGECILEDMIKTSMPGSGEPVTADGFFAQLAGLIEPYAIKCSRIGFCFSFPCRILENMDGEIIRFNKELSITGAQGRIIGSSLIAALHARGVEGDWKVTVLNDTVAALMGGLSQGRRLGAVNNIGLILGTGLNACCEVPVSRVKKLPGIAGLPGSMCINMELGGYDGFRQSIFDIEVDRESNRHDYHLYEKMVSGAYQGRFCRYMLREAARSGLLRKSADAVLKLETLETADVDAFCRDTNKGGVLAHIIDDSEKETVYRLFDAFYDRTARLIAVGLTAVILLADTGMKPDAPVCITADGSTFYKTLLFKPKLDRYMDEIAYRTYGRRFFFLKVEDGNLAGAAAAALTRYE